MSGFRTVRNFCSGYVMHFTDDFLKWFIDIVPNYGVLRCNGAGVQSFYWLDSGRKSRLAHTVDLGRDTDIWNASPAILECVTSAPWHNRRCLMSATIESNKLSRCEHANRTGTTGRTSAHLVWVVLKFMTVTVKKKKLFPHRHLNCQFIYN